MTTVIAVLAIVPSSPPNAHHFMLTVSANERAQDVCRQFISEPSRRYLFGATTYAADIADTIPVQGIIDDFIDKDTFHGLPIFKIADTPKNALVVSTTLGRPNTATKQLAAAGLQHCDFFTFHRYSNLDLPFARFWTGFREDARQHASDLEWVRSHFADEASRELFDRIRQFRLTANPAYIEDFLENQKQQYFEDFLELKPSDESFVDIGSFDGRTAEDFIERCPQFTNIFIFEPDPKNLEVVRGKFQDVQGVQCFPVGLGSTKATVRFSSSGSTSSVTNDGDLEVRIETLDSFDIHGITFLKMDIEGAELGAIQGAKETILREHPRLAICVYHQPSDLWRIPREIFSFRPDYDIFLRHYTEGVTETVMFFIPKR